MPTAENSARNVRTAARNVAIGLGVDPVSMSVEERILYNHALSAEILKYPQSFTAETLATAAAIVGKDYGAVNDTSFDWDLFLDAGLESARVTLPEVGKNLLLGLTVIGCFAAAAYFLPKGLASKLTAAP